MFKKLLKKIISYTGYKLIKKIDHEIENASAFEKNLIKIYSKYTMTSDVKIYSLIKSFDYIKKYKIDGDFVECGVFTGGNIMLLKNLLNINKLKKKIWSYDTFEGMTKPSSHDIKIDGTIASQKYLKKDKWSSCSLINVKKNFRKQKLDLRNVNFIKGKVEDTLKKSKNLPKKISILRLDTDFYESTKAELNWLYPLVVKGGIIIIDDYGSWMGSKKATDEYFSNKLNYLHFIDHSARLIIK
jgi:O-methyltransferase